MITLSHKAHLLPDRETSTITEGTAFVGRLKQLPYSMVSYTPFEASLGFFIKLHSHRVVHIAPDGRINFLDVATGSSHWVVYNFEEVDLEITVKLRGGT